MSSLRTCAFAGCLAPMLAAFLFGAPAATLAQSDDFAALRSQVSRLHGQGKYAEAVPLAERYVALARRKHGEKHVEFAAANAWLAFIYKAQARYAEAEPLYRRTLTTYEKVLGPAHPEVGASLHNLAELYRAQGRYAEAEPLYKRTLTIYEKALGADHPDVGTSLMSLAELYHTQGRYAAAEPLYRRTRAITEKALGADHPLVATSLYNLALLYHNQGRYAEAEPLYQRALAIREKALGLGHPAVGTSLIGLAGLYESQGRTAEAEPLYQRDLAITEKALGPDHPDVGTSLNNLAQLYRAQGRTGEAEPLYSRTLTIYVKALGPNHPWVGSALNNLAQLYESQGRTTKAEPLYQRALAIREKVLGPDHPGVGTTLNNLAALYDAQGRTAEAVALYQRALTIREKALGLDHPHVGTTLNNLAFLYFAEHDWARAADFWRRSTGVIVRHAQRGTDDVGQALTGKGKGEAERERHRFWGLVKVGHRLALERRSVDASLASEMFQTAQWSSASEAAASLAQMTARGAKGDPELAALVRERQDLVGEWQKRDQARSAAVSQAPDKRDRAAEAANVARLAAIDARIGEIDRRLAADFTDYAALARPQPLGIVDVQAELRADEALVLFLDTPEWEPHPEETFIWVVTKTDVRWVKSGMGTKALTERVAALRCGLDEDEWSGMTRSNKCAALLGRTNAPTDEEPPPFHLGIAHEIYQALFGPVEDLIKGKRLLIVPSGPLTSLPFHVLVTQQPETPSPGTFDGYRNVTWLARSHAIAVLPSVASLKALRAQSANRERAPADYIGIGNPILTGIPGECRASKVPDRCPTIEIASARPQLSVASAERATVRGRGGRRNAGKDLGEIYAKGAEAAVLIKQVRALCPLPDTDYELRCVAERFPKHRSNLLRDKLATETDLKKLNANGTLARYRVVHFATHGLVAGDVQTMTKRQGEPALVMTPPEQPADADDDGLLTASEVAQLKLNADWVVLSACSTAAGDGANAEALSGLARAFFYAGTRALLVSHWPVYSDAAVQLTTQAFAELERDPGLGRAEAFQRAMLALMEDRSLASNVHPAVWAPFVVVGEGGAESDVSTAAQR